MHPLDDLALFGVDHGELQQASPLEQVRFRATSRRQGVSSSDAMTQSTKANTSLARCCRAKLRHDFGTFVVFAMIGNRSKSTSGSSAGGREHARGSPNQFGVVSNARSANTTRNRQIRTMVCQSHRSVVSRAHSKLALVACRDDCSGRLAGSSLRRQRWASRRCKQRHGQQVRRR